MAGPIYIFAGGGTGGHLLPALAVAEKLTELQPEARVVFACSDREIDRRILSGAPYAFTPQPVRPLPRGHRGWPGFLRGFLASRRLARRMVRDLKPTAVFGLGGFAAAPVVAAAASAHVRSCLLNIDAVPGVANRHLARKVEVIFAQFPQSVAACGKHSGKVRVVGCPVRSGLADGDADEARKTFGLRADRKTLLVMAGSLGAASLNDALAGIRGDLEALADSWQVLHLAGPGKLDKVRAAWAGSAVHHVAMAFCHRMDLAYAAADVALARGGAATVAELTATGTPAGIMPYPHHRDRQQHLNAAALVAAGAALVIDDAIDPAANAAALRAELLPVLADPARLEALTTAAAGGAGTDSAGEIARWLCG